MQVKTTIGYHFTPPYWLKLKSSQYPVLVRIGQNQFLQPLWKNLTSPHKCSLDIRLFKTHITGLYLKTVCVNHSVVSNSLQPHGLYLPGSSVRGILQARILEGVAMPSSRGIFPTQGSNLHLLHSRWISFFTAESLGKPNPCYHANGHGPFLPVTVHGGLRRLDLSSA